MKVRYTCGCANKGFKPAAIYETVNPEMVDVEGWIECYLPLSQFVGTTKMFCLDCRKDITEEVRREGG